MKDYLTTYYYRYLRYIQAKDDSTATPYDKYMALAYAVRSQMVENWINTQKLYHSSNPRRIYYLSMEYVFGKSLKQNIINLGLEKSANEAATNLGFSLEELFKEEEDFDLGNPGRGGLAASFLDSMASLGMPGMGYGLHYDYALFQQNLINGTQIEKPYDWLHKGHPWEIRRPEYTHKVGFYGDIQYQDKESGVQKCTWNISDYVFAMPYDVPIPGYRNNTVNTLRLWSAQASEEFLPDYINHRDYVRACEEKFQSSRITNYLFPDDDVHRATEMRIKQQYFFVSASLQDIIRRYKLHNNSMLDFAQKVCIQLNGSRCAIAVAELMRLLIDNDNLSWDQAWEITRKVFCYTSHAVSADNLERWPFYIIEEILPRHTKIIYDINMWHLNNCVKDENCDNNLMRDLSIVEEGEVKWAKMANLAALGSICVNGVSGTQTQLLKSRVFHPLSSYLPLKIKNNTNGVALRRWLLCANKPLASLISELIGDSWIRNYSHIHNFEEYIQDSEVLARIEDIKHTAKRNLTKVLKNTYNITINPDHFLDIHCRKIHPYKRQMLHLLYIIHKYLQLKEGIGTPLIRTHIFGGRASPSDFLAKQIIHFIHLIVAIINNDSETQGKIQVEFIPNYGVSMAEHTIPAADLSEQLSTANCEASGTSNMKFTINGAITLASKSGSNIEIIEKFGLDTIMVFGHSGDELDHLPPYNPNQVLQVNKNLRKIFTFIDEVLPQYPDSNLVNPLLATLKDKDPFYVLREFNDYVQTQNRIDDLYQDRHTWLSMSLRSIARSGWFSSDRAIQEYSSNIWKLT